MLLPLAMIVPGAPQAPMSANAKSGVSGPSCSAPYRPFTNDTTSTLWLAGARTAVVSPVSSASRTDGTAPLEVWRAPDGLFYIDGAINGQTVRFVIDTGATMVVLTASDAKRAGVADVAGAPSLEAQTVSGPSQMARVTLASMRVGPTDNVAVPAAVASDALGVSLLGQSWLAQLASMTIEGDRMTLR